MNFWYNGILNNMIGNDKHIWVSAYLFYNGSANKFLIECIRPFIIKMQQEKDLLKYFFIRYNEGGSHIRLRLLVEKKRKINGKKG